MADWKSFWDKYKTIILQVVLALLAGGLASLLGGDTASLYQRLTPPPWAPPGWVFPVVWTILYALMGISAYLIHIEPKETEGRRTALTTYWVQLMINFSWSIVFFRFELLWGSVAVILALLVAVIVMVVRFRRISAAAAYINIPYILWLLLATYLNIATAVIN